MAAATKCSNCGADLPEGTVMCTQCGTNLQTGERFGTKVDDAKRKKKKKATKAPPTGVIIAAVVIGVGIWALDWQEKRKIRTHNEIRKAINDALDNAQKAIDNREAITAVEIMTELRSEVEGYMDRYSGHTAFVAELENILEEKVKPGVKGAMQARLDQEAEDLAMANKRAEEERKIKQGWARIDGKMVPPNEVRAKYRKIKGKYIAIATLERYGWFEARGDYRSPRTLYDMDYRQIEGTWRTIDDIKQIRGEVLVGGAWQTEREVLAGMPSKLITSSHPEGQIGRVTKLPGGSIRFVETYDKPISGKLDVVRRTYLHKDPPRAGAQPGNDRTRWLKPGQRLTRSRKSGDFYQVRTPPGKREALRGFVAAADVETPTEPSTKSITYPLRIAKTVRIVSLADDYRKPLAAMRTERDPARLLQLAKQWETDRTLVKWPNYNWKAKRCRDMAELIKKRQRPASDREVARALASKAPTDPRLPGIDMPAPKKPAVAKAPTRTTATKTTQTASTRTARKPPTRTTTKTTAAPPPKPKPKPAGYIVITADKASAVSSTKEVLATFQKGQRLPFFKKAGSWYSVQIGTGASAQTGWISGSQAVDAAAAASQPKETWVTVTADEARIVVKRGASWVTLATLKKGEKAKVLRKDDKYYWAEVTVAGKPVAGWLARKKAQ